MYCGLNEKTLDTWFILGNTITVHQKTQRIHTNEKQSKNV